MRFLAFLVVIAIIWLAGLRAFADRVQRSTPAVEPGRADGIVVLTGASDARITSAMQLLLDGRATRLLVSGVNREVRREELRALTPGPNRLFDCCVDLGFDAEDTLGNAQEIAAWAEAKDFDSLIVVTSDYHMPRALLEIRGLMRDAELIPYPVETPSLDTEDWWRSGQGMRRMTLEYSKYLVVLVREAVLRLFPEQRDEAAAAQAAAAEAAVGAAPDA